MTMLPRLGIRGWASLHRLCGHRSLSPEDRALLRATWRLLRWTERGAHFAWKRRVGIALILAPLAFLFAAWNRWDRVSFPPSLICASLAMYAGILSLHDWILEQDFASAGGFVAASAEVILILTVRWYGIPNGCCRVLF